MKKQPHSEVKLAKALSDYSPYRFQVLAKNFKKKVHEGSASTSGPLLRMDGFRKTETRSPPNKSESRNKSNRKRSLEKFLSHQKVTDRTSTLPVTATLSTKSKLMKINSTLTPKATSANLSEMLAQLYERMEDYHSLIKQWRQLDIFDEVDKMMQTVLETQFRVCEEIVEASLKHFEVELQTYQKTIEKLLSQNTILKEQIMPLKKDSNAVVSLQKRLTEEYEKGQWGTFILHSLSLNHFDLETYIKHIPLYHQWTTSFLLSSEQASSLSVKIEAEGGGQYRGGKSF